MPASTDFLDRNIVTQPSSTLPKAQRHLPLLFRTGELVTCFYRIKILSSETTFVLCDINHLRDLSKPASSERPAAGFAGLAQRLEFV